MFVTEYALLLMYVGTPLICLMAFLYLFSWKRKIDQSLTWYWAKFADQIDKDTDIDSYAKSVMRALKEVEELRDNHENLYTQFKKFRSRVTMQERRAAEKSANATEVGPAPGETKEQWKDRMRLQLLSPAKRVPE